MIIHNFFKLYAIWKCNRNFNPVKLTGKFTDKNLPVLLISNHISWWDGFWAMYLNLKVLKRKFHFMMLEEQLKKYWFFNYTGAFSINKKSRNMIESLNYYRDLLDNKKNMVLIFPQGEIQSMHNQKFTFEKGLERILKNKEGKIQIVFLANLPDYFSNPKPGLFQHFKEYGELNFSLDSIQEAYTGFYIECIEKQRLIQG